ncbi:MAG: hypothetical protein JXR76_04080 [Deltaproteobacteria bacterium]|nr:hypothetical protein [Deltaproteobacteria bacterium]
MLIPPTAAAKPGSHGWAVSTWDTTRSTIVFQYERGFLPEEGSSSILGYNANFTSTTGRLSAQFGMQYMNLTPSGVTWTMHGGSGSVVALYGIPIGSRYSNGMPKAAFSFYGGAVPTIMSNGQFTYVNIPFVLGLGMEMNPIRHLSIVPWVEGAPSFSLDTVVRYEEFQSRIEDLFSAEELQDYVIIEYNETTGVPENIMIDESVLDNLLNEVIEYEMQAAFRLRGGLSLVLNLGDRVDIQLNGTVAQIGSDFDAPPSWYVGTALVWAWDDTPLGILPEEARIKDVSCGTVQTKFESCAEYHKLVERIRAEEVAKLKDLKNKTIVVHEEPKLKRQKPDSPPPVVPPKTPINSKEVAPQPTPVPPPATKDPAVTPEEPQTEAPEEPPSAAAPPAPAPPPKKPATPPAAAKKEGDGKLKLPSLSQPIQ